MIQPDSLSWMPTSSPAGQGIAALIDPATYSQLRKLPHRRSILMLILAHIMGSTWLVEQPGSSMLYLHERFQWMLRNICHGGIPAFWLHASYTCGVCCLTLELNMQPRPTKQALWLRLWGHSIPKRTVLWSNSPLIRKLDAGKLRKRDRLTNEHLTTWQDKKGRRRVAGTSKLKATQKLVCII